MKSQSSYVGLVSTWTRILNEARASLTPPPPPTTQKSPKIFCSVTNHKIINDIKNILPFQFEL